MKNSRTFSPLRVIVTLVFIVLMMALAAQALDFDEFTEALRDANWIYLIPSTVLNVMTVGIIVLRWQTLLNRRAGFFDCLSANQIGAHLNVLLPLRLGDFTRSYLIRRHAPELSMIAILSSIGAELTFDMLVLMLLLALVLLVLPLPGLLTSAGLLLAVLTTIAAVSIFSLARSDWMIRMIIHPLAARFLPDKMQNWILGAVERIQDGLSSLRSNRQIAFMMSLTLLGYAVQVISNWLLLRVFLDDVALSAGLVALVGSGVGLALPLLPGSAGTYELAVTLALSSTGIDPEEAAAFALILHGQQVVMTIVFGSLFMLREGVSIHELRDASRQSPQHIT